MKIFHIRMNKCKWHYIFITYLQLYQIHLLFQALFWVMLGFSLYRIHIKWKQGWFYVFLCVLGFWVVGTPSALFSRNRESGHLCFESDHGGKTTIFPIALFWFMWLWLKHWTKATCGRKGLISASRLQSSIRASIEAGRNPVQKLRQSQGEEHCLHLLDSSATSYSRAQILSDALRAVACTLLHQLEIKEMPHWGRQSFTWGLIFLRHVKLTTTISHHSHWLWCLHEPLRSGFIMLRKSPLAPNLFFFFFQGRMLNLSHDF